MKSLLQTIFIAVLAALSVPAQAQVLAFPGADGGGRYVTGGRGGKVIHVTNLNDSGTGSLRDALNKNYARIIVFDVSGTIELQSTLEVKYGNVTIAGQTAPGDGICIKNHSTQVKASNVIIRFIRFRMGDEHQTENDAIWGRNLRDIIIDHCSMSWSTDECSSFYNNENFTMQWCILGESLRNSVHGKGAHGYGGIWGGTYASFHHNLILHHDSRNPRMCGPRFRADGDVSAELVDMRNCVFYNWGGNSGYAGEGGRYNFVNNYYKAGPATNSKIKDRIFEPYAYKKGSETRYIKDGSIGLFYVQGNYVDGYGEDYDFKGFDLNRNSQTTFYPTNQDGSVGDTTSVMNETNMRTSEMFTEGKMVPEETHTAKEAYELVLGYAGASLKRDAVDARYAREVRNGEYTYKGSNGSTGGLIDTQTDVGGYPTYSSTEKPADTDNDGMPDEWETANGLDPNTDDSAGNDLDTNYTNIEVYINSLVEDVMECTATVSTDETYGYASVEKPEVAQSTKWDFTAWSTETIANLVADATSWGDKAENRKQNSVIVSGTISANGVALAETEGLVFNEVKVGGFIVNYNSDPNSLQLNGGSLGFTIPNCPAGATITIDFASANSAEARGWTATNATLTSGAETTIDRTTATYTVTADGDVTLLTTSGLKVYSVELSTTADAGNALDDITAGAELVSEQIYSIDGKRLKTKTKGLNIVVKLYSNGAKQVEKVLVR